MLTDPQVLASRIAELTKACQRQREKAGQPEYDPALTELLKKDLSWLVEQQGQDDTTAPDANTLGLK